MVIDHTNTQVIEVLKRCRGHIQDWDEDLKKDVEQVISHLEYLEKPIITYFTNMPLDYVFQADEINFIDPVEPCECCCKNCSRI